MPNVTSAAFDSLGDEAAAPEGGDPEGGRRRGRGRDRYRREPRPDELSSAADDAGLTPPQPAEAASEFADEVAAPAAAPRPVAARAAPAAAPLAAVVPVVEPASAVPAVVEPFVLPISDLQRIAQGSGLEWVGSNAEKISAVQAAMAAEPKQPHVPRDRKPVPVIDEGPLVLVETRKDLSQLKLPFEQQGRSSGA